MSLNPYRQPAYTRALTVDPCCPAVHIPFQVYDRDTLMALSASPLALKSCLDQASKKQLLEPIRNSAPPEQTMASIAQMWREDNAKSAVSNRAPNSALSRTLNSAVSRKSVSSSIQQTPAVLYPSGPDQSLNVKAASFVPSSIPIKIEGPETQDRRETLTTLDEFAKGKYGSPAALPVPGIDRPFHPLPAKPVLCALPPSELKSDILTMSDRVGGTLPFKLGAMPPPPGENTYGDMSLPSMVMWTRRSSVASAHVPIRSDVGRRPSEDFAVKFAAFSFKNEAFPGPAMSEAESVGPQKIDRSLRRPSHSLLLGAVPMQSQVYRGERCPSQVYVDLGAGQQVDSSWRRHSEYVAE